MHTVYVANDIFWATGSLESLGNPNLYINQDGLNYIKFEDTHLYPWSVTGLPPSSPETILLRREKIQLVLFESEEAISQYRNPPRTGNIVIYMPLAIIKGTVPFYSEAKLANFLDFWKGELVPVTDASLYFMTEGPVELPSQAELLYVHRNHIQAYVEGT
jgi:hypothetical protein